MNDTGKKSKPAKKRQSEKPQDKSSDDTPQRIAKRIARAGLCSRRQAEAWIAEGRVSVNGEKLSSPAFTVTLADKIEVDGNPLPGRERTRLWLYHKPAGVLTTNRDPEGRPTLFEQLPDHLPRLLSIGRLDMNTEGLLLMTNDGGLARVLELPSTGWLRRYRVRVHGNVDDAKLASLKDGIAVDGILYGSIEAIIDRKQGTNTWLTLALREGKNREIKNVLAAIGLEVNRLIRISYGPFQLADIPTREIQEIRGRTLRDQLGERLVKEANADFEAPIITPAKIDKKPAKPKSHSSTTKPVKKTPRGAIAPGTMERLATRIKPDAGKKFRDKSSRKSARNSAGKSGRRSK